MRNGNDVWALIVVIRASTESHLLSTTPIVIGNWCILLDVVFTAIVYGLNVVCIQRNYIKHFKPQL